MTCRRNRRRFGIFLAPFHRVGENPTIALDRDLELTELLDRLNFDEAWFGEHHSAGWELIASPELMIAAAAQRTRTIRLGTRVSSLPYHPSPCPPGVRTSPHNARTRAVKLHACHTPG